MVYHVLKYKDSIVLKGSHTALVPIAEDNAIPLAKAKEVQWHLIGRKPALVDVPWEEMDSSHPISVAFAANDEELTWDIIERQPIRVLPMNDIKALVGKRMFVGYFPKVQNTLGTKTSGYGRVERSCLEAAEGNVLKLANINFNFGTNFVNGGIFNVGGNFTIKRSRYDNTVKQTAAFVGDTLRNKCSRPHILYDVDERTACMVPEACLVLDLLHRWASVQDELLRTDTSAGEQKRRSVLDHIPFVEASCNSAKRAGATLLLAYCEQTELPDQIRGGDSPTKPVTVAQIITQMYLAIDRLLEHQHKPRPTNWNLGRKDSIFGYEYVDVAEFDDAVAKSIRVNGSMTGGWHELVGPKSNILVFCGQKFGEVMKRQPDERLCGHWEDHAIEQDFLLAGGEALPYLQTRISQSGLTNCFLHYEQSRTIRNGHRQCDNNSCPCYSFTFQLTSKKPGQLVVVNEDKAVKIGRTSQKIKKTKPGDLRGLNCQTAGGLVDYKLTNGKVIEA